MRMACNARGTILLFAAMVLAAKDAAAQAPAQSFADLQPLVKVGQQVTVAGDDGRKTTGRFISLTGNQLEIEQSRGFFRRERRIFTEDAVDWIEHRDSTWNGVLLGLGVVASMAVLACKTEDYYSDDSPLRSCLVWVSFGPVVGGLIGGGIDGAINRTLYLSPGGTRRGSLVPMLGRERASLAATIRF